MQDDDRFAVQAAIAQRTRWRIIHLLAEHDGGLEAGAIARAIDATQSNASMQMSVLARAGLVASETQGRHVVYVLVRERLAAAGEVLRDLAARRI